MPKATLPMSTAVGDAGAVDGTASGWSDASGSTRRATGSPPSAPVRSTAPLSSDAAHAAFSCRCRLASR